MTGTVWSTFQDGLVITGVGMGLVFLTLILVMVIIWALSKLFPYKDELGEPVKAPVVAAPALVAAVAPSAQADDGAQAAAIAVALALESAQAVRSVTPAMTAMHVVVPQGSGPLPWEQAYDVEFDDEIVGEVVTVANIDAGSGIWKAQGRLDGTN